MRTFWCDTMQSLSDYAQNPDRYQKAMCYNNAFHLLCDRYMTDRSAKGVIGYVLSTDGVRKVAVRHAWVRRNDNHTGLPQVIDVTMCANDIPLQSVVTYRYVQVKEVTISEWLDYAGSHNGLPCIENIREEEEIVQSLVRDGYQVLGR